MVGARCKITLLFLILAAVCSCRAQDETGTDPDKGILFSNRDYIVYTDRVIEDVSAAVAPDNYNLLINDSTRVLIEEPGRYPVLTTRSSLINVLFHLACRDLHRLYRDEGYFVAGMNKHFNTKLIYTRDISYSSYLGLAFLMPDEVISHLRFTRDLRMRVGFRHSRGHEIPIPSVNNQLIDVPEHEFKNIYGTNSVSRRTDDIVWVLGWYHCWLTLRDNRLLEEMVEIFEDFDSAFYSHYFDPADGLYSGQASFIDIGGSGYPEELRKDRQMCTVIKSLSTNSLYYGAFRNLQKACLILGMKEKEKEFNRRADALGERIRTSFCHPEGYYAYFIHPDGRLEPRVEQLGSAFVSLFGIASAEESNRNLKMLNDNRCNYGTQVIYPFYQNPHVYHNNAVWPFADMIFNRARFESGLFNRDTVLYQSLGSLSRHALKGNFHELVRYSDGKIIGSPVYIWSNAAYLSFVIDLLLGIHPDEKGFTLKPCIPESLADLSLTDFRIGPMRINLEVKGYGDRVRKIWIDGIRHRESSIQIKPGDFSIRVLMEEV